MEKYHAEMGFTHHELLKGLPSAVQPYRIKKVNDLVYNMEHEDRVATMELARERTRSIAAITLPVTDVVISFQNFTVDQRQAFLDRFKKYLHRGGG